MMPMMYPICGCLGIHQEDEELQSKPLSPLHNHSASRRRGANPSSIVRHETLQVTSYEVFEGVMPFHIKVDILPRADNLLDWAPIS